MYLSFDLKTTDFDQIKAFFLKLGYRYFGLNKDSLYQGLNPLPAHEFRMTSWIQSHIFLRIEHNKLGYSWGLIAGSISLVSFILIIKKKRNVSGLQ
jgi:hypothetical protein